MVGLVIVAHSRALAQALMDLTRQVASPEVPMAIAAGAGPDHLDFGTDALEILEAVQSVYSPDGVLILMDLGSAVLSAQMAYDLLPAEMQAQVKFCAAPLVEGAIAAGVQAGLGSSLQAVCAEAQAALLPKAQQLGQEEARPLAAETPAAELESAERLPGEEITLAIKNLHGLHARPAARFVQAAARFQADIQVTNLTAGRGPVSAKSLNALATLGAVQDHRVRIQARGEQASQALATLAEMIEQGFGELETPPEAPAPAPAAAPVEPGALAAIPISTGIALGPLFKYQPPPPPIPTGLVEQPEPEWQRLGQAIEAVKKAIREQRRGVAASLGNEQAAIFDAHLLILEDPDLLAQTRAKIFTEKLNASAAWNQAITAVAEQYRSLPDPYLRQRAADVLDVGSQLLFALAGEAQAGKIELPEPIILVAEELTPTQTAQLDLMQVLGVITLVGGPTSHSAILARSLGIPAVTGAPLSILRQPNGVFAALDGASGAYWIDPPAEKRAELVQRRADWLEERSRLLQSSHKLALTRDGQRIEVVANAGNLQDARAALANGAEGIGLLRTEFLFLTRQQPPSEEEQFEALSQIGAAMGEHPVIVRTLDVGGDKELPYIELPAEANPFLGVRAIRLSRQRPDLFRDQLRAILRAGAGANFRIMFPMVAELSEVRWARQALEEAHQQLTAQGLAHQWPVETGIMVEVPSAAMMADGLAGEVDFFSIGTNDLTQYTLAAERGNPNLAGFADALHPAVLRLIGRVAEAAHARGKWVGVCGELAGDPAAAAALVGLGVDELSMNPGGIPAIKAILRRLTVPQARQLAREVTAAADAPAARRLAQSFLEALPPEA
jgi:phosphocarrier protein FPr